MMRSSAICVALLATSAHAQNVAAGAKAVVSSETLPVYTSMSSTSAVKETLSRGAAVTIGLVMFGDDTTWCAVSKSGETRRLGYAACEFLEPERSTPRPMEKPAPAPITIREAPPILESPKHVEPLAIREPMPGPPPPPAPSVDLVSIAMEDSGLRANVANYVQSTHPISFLDKSRLEEIEVPLVDRALAALFRSDAFSRAIADQMRRDESSEQLKALVEWLQSPLTRKIVELERKSLEPESHEELVAFATGLKSSPPPEARLLLIHRLFEASQTCGIEVDSTITLVKAVARAIGPALSEEKRYTDAELNRALAAVKPRYSAIMKNARLVHYLFALRTVSDEELEQHVNFLESENGKWFVSAVRQGFADATGAISRNLRAEIFRQIKLKQR